MAQDPIQTILPNDSGLDLIREEVQQGDTDFLAFGLNVLLENVLHRSSFLSFRVLVPFHGLIIAYTGQNVNTFLKKFFSFFYKKRVDKSWPACYNKDAPRGGTGESAGTS